jgi:hypothetical protein
MRFFGNKIKKFSSNLEKVNLLVSNFKFGKEEEQEQRNKEEKNSPKAKVTEEENG